MSGWIAVLATACAACSSHSSANAAPAGEAAKAVTVAQAPPAPSKPTPEPVKVPLQIDRQMPDAGWVRAADATLTFLKPWLDEARSYTRLVLKPLTAPDGSRLDYLILYEAFSAKGSEYTASVLIVGDKAIGQGEKAATHYLHAVGFPGKRIERGLLLEVLQLTGVVTAGWGYQPSVFGWPKAFDDDGMLDRERGVVTYDKSGATFTLYRRRPTKLQEEMHLADRLVYHFDSAAAITVSSAREQQDKSWKTIPVAP